MKLPWQKETTPSVPVVKGRAAVIPKSYKFFFAKNLTQNNFTVNSYTTVTTTVKVLEPEETAESVNTWLPGTINFGAEKLSLDEVEAQGLQRVQFDAPNWIGMIISQDGTYYVEHVELPVWIDPATRRVQSVDVPELLQKYEHRREELSRYWGRTEGPFSDFFDIIDAPKTILKAGKFFASLPGEWIGAIKELKDDLKKGPEAWVPLAEDKRPDMSQYPPIDGISFDQLISMSCNPAEFKEMKKTVPGLDQTLAQWTERVKNDQKLGAFYFNEMQRVREGR